MRKRLPPAAPVRPLSLAFDLVMAAAVGALQTSAFVYTEVWWVQVGCVAWLAWRAAATPVPRAALLGWTFGTAWLVAGTWWLFISMNRYGGLPAWMAALAVLALGGLLSLYLAGAMAVFARWRSGRPASDALLFAAVWLLSELARGLIFTGFPWVASGYAHVDGPMAALAPWVGVYGIGFVAAWMAAWAALSFMHGPRPWVGGAIAVAVLVGVGFVKTPSTRPSGTLSVTLLQGNIPQEQKFQSEHQMPALEWHVNELVRAASDLVVAPETAVPYLPQQLPEGFWPSLKARFSSGRTHALFGVPLGSDEAGYTNSAVGFAPGRPDEYHYAKYHLVPFGEFIPTGFKWFTRMMNIPLGDFNRGRPDAPSFVVGSERIAPNICYEDLFGEELALRFVDPDSAPTIFANLSNIGWFGDTIAVDQHLNISRMRALEFQRPMLRATNTGATVIIDHLGHVTFSMKPFTRGVLEGSVQGRTGLTPYVAWSSRYSLWPLVAVAGVLLLFIGALKSRLERRPRSDRAAGDSRLP
jgi:apolipoprotein N-acyltransferase